MTIQRYDLQHYEGYTQSEMLKSDPDEPGYWVRYSDHLAALQRERLEAKLSVLEEEDAHMVGYLGTYTDENREWRQAKIAALRKELEG